MSTLATTIETQSVSEDRKSSNTLNKVVAGTSALGLATVIERGLGMAASVLAARWGGASVFGAYSLALTTANNISAYTGSGIGNTAIRFAGAHDRSSREYGPITRALLLVTACSCVLAALLMLAASGPLAHYVLKIDGLTNLIRFSAVSAAAIIALECAKGFFVGQRAHGALLLLASLAGIGLLAVVPLASRTGPTPMVLGHGVVVMFAVLVCIGLAGPLKLKPLVRNKAHQPLGPAIRQVWGFGMVQLTSLLSMNMAGWWLTSMIARSDPSMVQTGLFAVSHQIRNMVAMAPAMLAQSTYALMIDRDGDSGGAANRMVSLCTFATSGISLALAGIGMVAAPWILPAVYGSTYQAAVLPTIVALATAVAHMGSAPVFGRLTIVNVKRSGTINLIWAVAVASAATCFVSAGGALTATFIYLAGFLLMSWLNLGSLRRYGLAPGVLSVTLISQASACAMVALAFLRIRHPASQGLLAIASLLILGAALFILARLAKHHQWIPAGLSVRHLAAALKGGAQ
jgi:O-antigen/teichoic acid export membrane protein